MSGSHAASPAFGPNVRLDWLLAGLAGALVLVVGAASAADAIPVTTGEFIIIATRLVLPLLILRFWLVGGLVAMLIDATDVILIELVDLGGFGDHYAETDKILDSYYYVLELVVALRWANPWVRLPSIALFAYRIVGAIIFEFSSAHIWLFFFPNMFENWWLYVVVVMKWFPSLVPRNAKTTAIPMVLLLIPKLGQEYLLHVSEAHPWDWTKESILGRLGIEM